MGIRYHIDEVKYRIKPGERYIRVNGWGFGTRGGEIRCAAVLNGKKADGVLEKICREDVVLKYRKYHVDDKNGFCLKLYLEGGEIPESFQLYLLNGKERKLAVNLNQKGIVQATDSSTMSYRIDGIRLDDRKVYVSGWIASVKGNDAVQIDVLNQDDRKVDARIQKEARADLIEARLVKEKDKYCGFKLEFFRSDGRDFRLVFSDGLRRKYIRLNLEEVWRKQKIRSKTGFAREALKHVKPSAAHEILSYVKENGVHGLKEYIVMRVNTSGKPYKVWFKENMPSEKVLQEQRDTVFDRQPKISLIVPTYKTPVHHLQEMIESVRAQSYPNWELCVADGSEGDPAVEAELKRYHMLDERIRYKILEKNFGIAGNTNGALELASGEYIGLFDHDDILAPNALYEVVKSLQEDDYDIIYTDEDKVTDEEKEHIDPNFKPDFSIDLFRSHNYITHFFVVKAEIMEQVGGFRSEYDGSQDYDLMFRCIEISKKIKHIPMILYHWRIHMNSVAGNPESKMYAYEAGKKAIEAHLERMHIDATVEHLGLWGMYHVKYATPGNPLISVIIANKDHAEDLDTCIKSLFEKSSYTNFEVIIVENNSEEAETFEYYERIKAEHEQVKVVVWEGGFNYSAINNYGVQYAKGEYLLFLNNDTELIAPESMEEMLGCCMREDVGAVGAKLLYGDDTVQHAGVVVGFGNYAGHVNTGIGRDDYGYMVRARINCNYSAVTAACMMTKKSLFEKVGGFDEQFVVACNDVDYCLKLRELGKMIVFNAFSEWYHYESKSRGYEDTEEKLKRFEGEIDKFQVKWKRILEEGDPFYNKNFPVTRAPFTLG